MPKEKGKADNPEKTIREFWRKHGHHSVIAAKHTEFTVEPKVLIGDKLNPEILKLMVSRYLELSSRQDSGTGNIEYTGDKLTIKGADGKPLVIVRDKKLIEQYLSHK